MRASRWRILCCSNDEGRLNHRKSHWGRYQALSLQAWFGERHSSGCSDLSHSIPPFPSSTSTFGWRVSSVLTSAGRERFRPFTGLHYTSTIPPVVSSRSDWPERHHSSGGCRSHRNLSFQPHSLSRAPRLLTLPPSGNIAELLLPYPPSPSRPLHSDARSFRRPQLRTTRSSTDGRCAHSTLDTSFIP